MSQDKIPNTYLLDLNKNKVSSDEVLKEDKYYILSFWGLMIYPKISPCVLALIKKDNQILLARNALFPEGLYSALAGFVEVSETAEETVIREVFEEVSLKVNNINYFASQAWPFPSQLMLAYTCDYVSGDIKVDGSEIIDAKWFDIDNLPNIPPNSTLSGRLINSCISDR